jgi:hypothetical protein
MWRGKLWMWMGMVGGNGGLWMVWCIWQCECELCREDYVCDWASLDIVDGDDSGVNARGCDDVSKYWDWCECVIVVCFCIARVLIVSDWPDMGCWRCALAQSQQPTWRTAMYQRLAPR